MTTLTAEQASDLFRAAPDQYVTTAQGRVAVRSVGTGPDVLFVHGWPVSGATFRHLLPALTPHLRCHVVDLVGAGDSQFTREAELTIATHVQAVRDVVAALGLDDVAVVGHDSGGLIARHALAGDPRVRAWGLLGTEHPKPSWRLRSFLAARHVPRVERVLGPVLTSPALRRQNLVFGTCFVDRSRLDGEFDEFFLEPLRLPDRRWAMGRLINNFDLADIHALADLHRKMTQPTVLVYGAKCVFFPINRVQESLSSFAGPTQLTVIEDGSLFAHEECPDAVAAALLPTLLGS